MRLQGEARHPQQRRGLRSREGEVRSPGARSSCGGLAGARPAARRRRARRGRAARPKEGPARWPAGPAVPRVRGRTCRSSIASTKACSLRASARARRRSATAGASCRPDDRASKTSQPIGSMASSAVAIADTSSSGSRCLGLNATHANGRSSPAAHSARRVVLPYPAGATMSATGREREWTSWRTSRSRRTRPGSEQRWVSPAVGPAAGGAGRGLRRSRVLQDCGQGLSHARERLSARSSGQRSPPVSAGTADTPAEGWFKSSRSDEDGTRPVA